VSGVLRAHAATFLLPPAQVAGRRTVPVEVGSHYLAEGWGTQLMTLDAFLAAINTPGARDAA
jgi:hypothetical protein